MNQSRGSRRPVAIGGLTLTILLTTVAIVRHGWPLNVLTWLAVLAGAASGLSLARRHKGKAPFRFAIVFCCYLALPELFQIIPVAEKWSLFDDVGGRPGWEMTPGLRFGHDGPNTGLMESYVGPLHANWRYQAPHSPYVNDGNERVQSRNLIRSACLPTVLAMLPDDAARRTVVLTLTDPENRLRVHQGLLLSCLFALDYPRGFDARSWWSRHAPVFRSQHDPVKAASLAYGWLPNIDQLFQRQFPSQVGAQYRAARYQQQGHWGGHQDFGEAYLHIEHNDGKPDPSSVELANSIVWWPERRP